MEAKQSSKLWGQLSYTSETELPILLEKPCIRIGRSTDCDVSFVSNNFISHHHCTITHDERGKTWLTDNRWVKNMHHWSETLVVCKANVLNVTNGTIVNGRRLKKGKKTELNHHDKILLVNRKNHPSDDIGFTFEDLNFLQAECNLLESTQEYCADLTTAPELKDESDDADGMKREKESSKDRRKNGLVEKEMKKDNMGETLMCGICQDIFHDCLSLQPCLHSFCSSCYSQWMERSKECPTCRLPVERFARSCIINNLVEAYLKDHPEKQRSAEEIAEMDAKNKISDDMLRPNRKRKRSQDAILLDDSDSDIESESSQSTDSNSSDEDGDDAVVNLFAAGVSSFGSLFGFGNSARPSPSVCRWCPGSRRSDAASLSQSNSSATGVASMRPGFPQPQCRDNAFHITCLCCLKPMPRYEDLPDLSGGVRSQKCGICSNFFCHLLWKCDKPGCLGCLNEFKDLVFSSNCLDGLILNNKYESQILKNYLNNKGWLMQDLLSKCLQKLDAKTYVTTDCVIKPDLNSKFVLCHRCGLKNLKELAFLFRRDIPKEELPAAVTSRPDCHWGRNCRTQTNPHNPHHASRYNHVCEQTRFAS